MNKKVLQILPIPIFPLIGPCLRCLRQSQGLRKRGYEVAILSRRILHKDRSKFDDPFFEGLMILSYLPSLPTVFFREIAHIIYSWWTILKTINKIKPDIIHVHNPPETVAFVTSLICAYKRIPFIYDIHDGVYELISSLTINPLLKKIYLSIGLLFERVTLKKCSGVVTVSDSLKDAILKRAGNTVGSKPFVVMKNIDPRLNTLSVSYGEVSEGNYILFSGTLYTAIIGLEDVIDLMPELYKKTGVKFLIAGDGPYRVKLEEYAKEKGIKDEVDFCGHIDRKSLSKLINGTKLCMAPFRRNPQLNVALPNKLFEYMALGKPIVYPDLPGFREVMGDNNEGKYEPDNKEDMARVMENMLSKEELRKTVGEKNRELIKKISFENELSKMIKLYERLINAA